MMVRLTLALVFALSLGCSAADVNCEVRTVTRAALCTARNTLRCDHADDKPVRCVVCAGWGWGWIMTSSGGVATSCDWDASK